MKLFFALWPDVSTREHLHSMQARLLPLIGGRGTAPNTFHITLCFLGEVDPARLNILTAIGSEIDGRTFEMQINKVSCFEKAKVGWAGSKQVSQPLVELQAAIQNAVNAEGFDIDRSTFRPHITLVRHLPQAFETMSTQGVRWPVSGFSLVASLPDAGGVRYELLKTWALRV